ncbi:hypothetical protein Golob_005174, partial [Gossypium lobatum]|nr:hypothetical protein [Gossypium lobatum]
MNALESDEEFMSVVSADAFDGNYTSCFRPSMVTILVRVKAPFVLCRVFAKPRFGNTLDDPIATRAVSVGSFEFHSGILPDLRND